jgi:hypothetical protein
VGRGAPSAFVVLAEAEDVAAAWLAGGLVKRGLPVELVTPTQLCDATTLDHRLAEGSATFRIALADGRVLDSGSLAGVVNRMVRVPLSALARSEPADRTYVEAEWRALLCSLLDSLPLRLIDPPHPHSLAGRHRSSPEWLVLADQAGLQTPRWEWTEGADAPALDPEPDGEAVRLLVMGGEVISLASYAPVPVETADACRRLAELASVSILEVRLAKDDGLTFQFADRLPDLRDGGERIITAVIGMLGA